MFTRFSRYPAGKLISYGALWAIDELNSYNSIVGEGKKAFRISTTFYFAWTKR
jgi:hypothetical protein